MRSQVTGVSPGFCTSTQVSKPSPVEPSARYQSGAGVEVPMEAWAQARSAPYMARSTTTPSDDSTRVETS